MFDRRVLPMSLLIAFALVASVASAAPVEVKGPLVCSRGPSGTTFTVAVTVPLSTPNGSVFTVRIDSKPSGIISHTGLNYLHDMQTDYALSAGATFVDGSARVVPGTGTSNVSATARVAHDASGIHLYLPAHVDNGTGYTPPSIEFQVKADTKSGAVLAVSFVHYEVLASAVLIGDVKTVCEPNPKPYNIGLTYVE